MDIAKTTRDICEKIKDFTMKSNRFYEEIPEPNRFFLTMFGTALPVLAIPGGWCILWILLLIAWRMLYSWWKSVAEWEGYERDEHEEQPQEDLNQI